MDLEQSVSNAGKRERKATEIRMYVCGYKLIRDDQNSRAEQCESRQKQDQPGYFHSKEKYRLKRRRKA